MRILDVGQGDATLIENGGSRVLIDGGPSEAVLGRHLDRLGLNGDTIHALLISHAHHDHYNGLHALFETRRRITVRYVFESRDASPNVTLFRLRDSIIARAERGELQYRDTDDPCGDGSSVCMVSLRGGARLQIMRPYPDGSSPNDRSTPSLLIGPDSASFRMWFAGDAEHDAIRWFSTTGYDRNPGMRAHVLKGNHHGSCNGVTRAYLELIQPRFVVLSLAAINEYGHVHTQTTDLMRSLGIQWYRTDQNGEITIAAPGRGGEPFTISGRGASSQMGRSDRRSSQNSCT